MTSPAPDAIAAAILAARAEGRCLTAPFAGVEIDHSAAYAVQERVTAARISRGERQIGWKLGYTSTAMREQMGISEPNYGPLTDAMLLPDGGEIPTGVLQPRVEPEIAFLLASDIREDVDARGIRGYVAEARAALEVVDSVWRDYQFTWADNTADGSSAAFVVVGPPLPTEGLSDLPVTMWRNGESVGEGRGGDAMGDPFEALAWLSGRLLAAGGHLAAGSLVITGGLVRAVGIDVGDRVEARVGGAFVTVRR